MTKLIKIAAEFLICTIVSTILLTVQMPKPILSDELVQNSAEQVPVYNAEAAVETSENVQVYDQQAETTEKIYAEIVSEVAENRERYVRHYALEDGSYIAASYTEPANYLKDGQWEQIDNSLQLAYDPDLGDLYQNTGNSFNIQFSKNSDSDRLCTLSEGGYSIGWSFVSGDETKVSSSEAEISNYIQDAASLSGNDRVMDVGKSSSGIVYKSILPDIDLRYRVEPAKVKEDLIIRKRTGISSFVFNIYTNGMTATLNEDNSVSMFDPKDPGTAKFFLLQPYMMDSAEDPIVSHDIEIALNARDFGYELVLAPDPGWMNSPDRVYPITIDPTVTSSQAQSDILDTYVHSGDAAGNHYLEDKLVVGTRNGEVCKGLIKTTIPPLPGVDITDARLNLSITQYTSTTNPIHVYKINEAWSSSTMCWSEYLDIGYTLVASNVPATSYSNSPSALRYSCNVTSTVESMHNGSIDNFGFMVRYSNEAIPDYNRFYSAEYTTAAVRPTLVVTYTYQESEGITDGGIYYIKNKNSGKYMDVEGAGTGNGTDVIQWTFSAAANQQWKTVYEGSGLYRLMPQNAQDKYLSLESYTNQNGINIDIYGGDYPKQYWSILSNGNGSYRILSECSDYFKGATVEGASFADGATIFQYTYSGAGSNDNDDWIFEEQYSVPQCLIPQQMDNWCWAASAEMLAKIEDYNFTRTQQDAVDYIYPPIPGGSSWNFGGTLGQEETAAEYISDDTIDYTHFNNHIYTEETVVQLLRTGFPVGISRGYYDGLFGTRTGGHASVVYRYYYSSTYEDMVFHILDPWPVNIGDIFPMTYSEMVSEGTTKWDGIVIMNSSLANNVIDMP